MKFTKFHRKSTPFFSSTANKLVYNQNDLTDFIQSPFDISAFEKQIETKKNFDPKKREILVSVLKKQYQELDNVCSNVIDNVNIIKEENTFTITTGHQLNIYTGPLFFFYKIIHVIKLSKQLKEKYPQYNFVPVYWMASEDHDFEEINHLHLFNQKHQWKSKQSGAVGRFSLNDFQTLKSELLSKFSNNEELQAFISKQYAENDNLSLATFKLVNELFGEDGLVIIEPDNAQLKAQMIEVFENEINSNFSSKAVSITNKKLAEAGLNQQLHSREINLFYLSDQKRSRLIEIDQDNIEIDGKNWKKSDLIKDLKENPENFSPNVVLRPLYQEKILPNLAYIGGGGELAYWLQLKGVFQEMNVPFPLLQVRNSVQVIDKGTVKKLEKLSLKFEDFFQHIHELEKSYVLNHFSDELDFKNLNDSFDILTHKIIETISETDQNLKSYAESEAKKLEKQIQQIQQKLIRHKKKQHETTLSQINKLNDKLFPDGGLQERHENILEWFDKFGIYGFKKIIFDAINPKEKDFIVILDAE